MVFCIIYYIEFINFLNFLDNICYFEDEKICGYIQDLIDNFDWMWQNVFIQNFKCFFNIGFFIDISGIFEGYYMFIEILRFWELGDCVRLVSFFYNVSVKFYCVFFFYYMYGKYIGFFNFLVWFWNKGVLDMYVWFFSGNKGNVWQQVYVFISFSGFFQIIFEGV